MVRSKYLFLVLASLMFLGCSHVTETVKIIWGNSTRALEEARVDGIHKTYRCSFNDCYDSVLSLKRQKRKKTKEYTTAGVLISEDDTLEEEIEVIEGAFDIFIDNRAKKTIVVMGIEGNVDTTEVGIFFSQPSLTTVKLEVSSLSSNAKRNVAEAIFEELDSRFSSVE